MVVLHYLPHGRVETFDDQEVKHASDNADQAKYRFSIPEHMVGPGSLALGGFSGNTERPDGELDERGLAYFRSLGDGRWAFCVAIQYAKGEDPKEVLLVTSDGIYGNEAFKGKFQGPINIQFPSITQSPGGECQCHTQGDGNQVMYDVRSFVTLNGSWPLNDQGQPLPGVPLSTLKDGNIRDFRQDGQY